jgi:hypothetical protein
LKPLQNRPLLNPKESVSSYVYRLASVNYNVSVTNIAILIGIPVSRINNNDFDDNAMFALSEISTIPYVELKNNSIDKFETILGKEYYQRCIMKNRVKYCPTCFINGNYHRHDWGLLPLNVCMEHQLVLVDRCKSCNSLISMNALMAGSCNNCNFLFATTPSVPVLKNTEFFRSQVDLYRRFFCMRKCQFNLSTKEYLRLANFSFYLLSGLQSFIDPEQGVIASFHNKKGGVKSSDALSRAYANVYWMYKNFPFNFQIVLDAFFVRFRRQQMYMKKASYEKLFEESSYTEIYSAYKKYWLDRASRGDIRVDFSIFKKEPGLLTAREYIRKDELRRVEGISYGKLDNLNKHNEVKMLNIPGNKYLIEKASYEKMRYEGSKLITKAEAALILGIHPSTVPNLVDAGYLKPIKKETLRYAKFDLVEVTNLINSVRGTFSSSTEGISFEDVLKKYNKIQFTVAKIIEFTSDGLLHAKTKVSNGTLRDNYYSHEEIMNCIKIIKNGFQRKRGYSKKDLMEMLHLGEKRLNSLLEEVKPDFVLYMRDGRKRYYFREETISEIGTKHPFGGFCK